MATGYNASDIEDLRQQFISYIAPDMDPSDPDDVDSWENLRICPGDQVIARIRSWDFCVEENEIPFEPEYEFEEVCE